MLFCFRNGDREQQRIITLAVFGQAIMLAANTFRVSRHTGGHGGRSRFLTPFPAGNIGNYTHRKPYRKGVVCVTVASLILICGSIMTILGKCLFLGASGVIFSSPARSAQSYCCHLGRTRLRLRLRVRPCHTFG